MGAILQHGMLYIEAKMKYYLFIVLLLVFTASIVHADQFAMNVYNDNGVIISPGFDNYIYGNNSVINSVPGSDPVVDPGNGGNNGGSSSSGGSRNTGNSGGGSVISSGTVSPPVSNQISNNSGSLNNDSQGPIEIVQKVVSNKYFIIIIFILSSILAILGIILIALLYYRKRSRDRKISEGKLFVASRRLGGYSDKEIIDAFKAKGWSDREIDKITK
jgi:hypothetical protein